MFFSYPKDFETTSGTGITRHRITGDKLSVMIVQKEADPNYDPKQFAGTAHSHDEQENIIIVLKGEVTCTVRGETRLCKPMDALLIPPGVMHSVDPGSGESEVIEIWSPPSGPRSQSNT